MSFIPTEKIHLSKNPNLKINTNENKNNNPNFPSNINPKYSSPFKKIPNNYNSQYSPTSQMINYPLNPNSKTLFVYPPRQYIPYYDPNINLYQKNYYYMNNNDENINNRKNESNKDFSRKDQIKQNNTNEKINMNINMNVSNNVYHLCLGEKNNLNNNIQLYSTEKYEEEKRKKKFICRCKKSNCMKLYCDCFVNGEKCIGCNCINCSNVIGNEINIKKVYDEVVGKNPVSMKLNLQKELKTNGCNCSKSNCLKKYCECYKAGFKCSKICRCKICENKEKININRNQNEEQKDIKKEENINNKDNINNNILEKNNENVSVKESNKKNKDDESSNISIDNKKYNYDKFMFEKISVLIKNDKLSIQKYTFLKDLELKDEFNNNLIHFTNNTDEINKNIDSTYLQKKTHRPKGNDEK